MAKSPAAMAFRISWIQTHEIIMSNSCWCRRRQHWSMRLQFRLNTILPVTQSSPPATKPIQKPWNFWFHKCQMLQLTHVNRKRPFCPISSARALHWTTSKAIWAIICIWCSNNPVRLSPKWPKNNWNWLRRNSINSHKLIFICRVCVRVCAQSTAELFCVSFLASLIIL